MPSTHKKEKPWDTDDIDKWKEEVFTPDDNAAGAFAEESSFLTLFPKYREQYLRTSWPVVTRALAAHHIACTLDLITGSMTVKTTRKTFDPAAILNARDLIRLLARSVPAPQAIKILDDGVACDIVKIRGLVRTRERFVKRRQRLLGPNGSTLKALELLTDSYILVQGSTVATMGPYKGLKEVRRVVTDCLHNVHPIYHIKELMIKRELAKDPALANESWDRFLPQLKKRALSRRFTPHKVSDKSQKPYTPFPPPREKSKVDLQIESGEYFLGKQARDRQVQAQRAERQQDKTRARQARREADLVPPVEPGLVNGKDTSAKKEKKKKRKREAHADTDANADPSIEVEETALLNGDAASDGVAKRKKRKIDQIKESGLEDSGDPNSLADQSAEDPVTKKSKRRKRE